jgi:predicted secreted protein
MQSKTPTTHFKNPAFILAGFALGLALSGCQTNEGHKSHHHSQGHVKATPKAAETQPSQKAQEEVNPQAQITSQTPPAGEVAPVAQANMTPTAATAASEPKAEKTITIDAATFNGKEKRVEARMPEGGMLTIQLPFQASTGYNWALSSISSDLKMMSQTTRSLSDDGRSGGPMLAVYVLKCLSADSAETARFELSRPWETDISPVQELIVLVNGASTDDEN